MCYEYMIEAKTLHITLKPSSFEMPSDFIRNLKGIMPFHFPASICNSRPYTATRQGDFRKMLQLKLTLRRPNRCG